MDGMSIPRLSDSLFTHLVRQVRKEGGEEVMKCISTPCFVDSRFSHVAWAESEKG
jgi:hypothetical protein